MWSYEEDWEFRAEIDFVHTTGYVPIYNEKFYQLEDPNINPYYFCWMSSVSRNVNLYSTSVLMENKVKDVKLLDIPIDDIRITHIYSILVKQWSDNIDKFGCIALSKSGKIDMDAILYSRECVDCRKTKGATKKRPDFCRTIMSKINTEGKR